MKNGKKAKRYLFIAMTALACSVAIHVLQAQEATYARVPVDPAHTPVPEAERGEIIRCSFSSPAIYPGTKRDYWIYVPAAYTPDRPACVFVCLDGVAFNAPTVFDRLIPKGDMPVTVGVFVAPGAVHDADGKAIHHTRQYEYDTMDDTFVRFLTEELFPDVERQTASDGRPIRLSGDGNDRAIAGCSSGGICAFNAAWHRPDAFSRVLSCCGSFAALHGGSEFHALVRKAEPKPVRVFLDAGMLDVALPAIGNLYEANVTMESALRFAGYEVDHAWHLSGHDATHATQTFPDLMRWLWKGWPQRIQAGPSNNQTLVQILDSASGWEPVALPPLKPSTVAFPSALLSNAQGDVFVSGADGTVYRLEKGETPSLLWQLSAGEKLLACAGRTLYTADVQGRIHVYDNGRKRTLARNMAGAAGIAVSEKGHVYVAQRLPGGERAIWLLDEKGNKTLADRQRCGGVQMAFAPGQRLLACSEDHSHWVSVHTVNGDGTLSNGCRYYWQHNPDNSEREETGSMTFDTGNHFYVATDIGVQISEPRGINVALLSPPAANTSAVCFAGENRDVLFVLSGDKVYRRKMKARGQ
ncbi:MAG: hypothetical protein LBT76_03395 [Tannerella sp.]|nr:hypothetical protein [Tannerella sp.]